MNIKLLQHSLFITISVFCLNACTTGNCHIIKKSLQKDNIIEMAIKDYTLYNGMASTDYSNTIVINNYEFRFGLNTVVVNTNGVQDRASADSTFFVLNHKNNQVYRVKNILSLELDEKGRTPKNIPGYNWEDPKNPYPLPKTFKLDKNNQWHYKLPFYNIYTKDSAHVELVFQKIPRNDSLYTLKRLEKFTGLRMIEHNYNGMKGKLIGKTSLRYYQPSADTISRLKQLIVKLDTIGDKSL